MRFYGTLLAVATMLLLGLAFLIIFVCVNFSPQYFWIEATFLAVGVFLSISAFHEFCHIVGLVITHNQNMVRGLTLSHGKLAIRYEGKVPSEDAALVYLLSLLTMPVAFFAFYWLSPKYLMRFLPSELEFFISIIIAVCSLPFTYAMSKYDISDWKRLRDRGRQA